MKLNPAQNEAVKYVNGPCLVLAGAGSGKTRVITNKIAHLIQNCGFNPKNITAVTFTNKAAKEMKERVNKTLQGNFSKNLKISTFHTLGLNIIREEYKNLKLKANFSLFDDQDQMSLLKELTEKEFKGDNDLLKQLISAISHLKNTLILPDKAKDIATSKKEKIFAEFYDKYQKQLKAFNALDFDDLILLPTLLLRDNLEVQEKWQNKIKYLLVDEYQDTNTSQYELIKYIVGKKTSFTVVGDDDQSIYSWRGAQPENLNLLKQDFPSLKVIKLEQNYRSSQRILKCANELIANNDHLFEKNLFSNLNFGDRLKILIAKDEENEATRVISGIISHKFLKRTRYKDYAILYRGNHQSKLLEKELISNNIPYKVSGGQSFFARSEIKDIMAYLRLLVNDNDDSALIRIINVPKREIGATTLQKIGTFASSKNISIFEALFDSRLSSVLNARALNNITNFGRMIVETQDRIKRSDPYEALTDLIKTIQYQQWLYDSSKTPKSAEMRVKNVVELLKWVQNMLEGNQDNDPMTFEQAVSNLMLRDMLERQEDDSQTDQVQLMTLHASKGLEFPYVYMIGMEEGMLPHQNSIDNESIAEERRLAYVGITRAQQELTFMLTKQRNKFGEKIITTPSRFLSELPEDDIVWEENIAKPTTQQRQKQAKQHIASLRDILNK